MYPEEFTTSNNYYGGYLDLTGKEIAILKDNKMERAYFTIVQSSRFFKSYQNGRRVEYNLAICKHNISDIGFKIDYYHLGEFNLPSHYLGQIGVLITTQEIMQDSDIVINGIFDKDILLERNLKNKELEAHSTRMKRVEKEKEIVTTKNSVERTLPPQTKTPLPDSPSTDKPRKVTIVNLIPTKKLV